MNKRLGIASIVGMSDEDVAGLNYLQQVLGSIRYTCSAPFQFDSGASLTQQLIDSMKEPGASRFNCIYLAAHGNGFCIYSSRETARSLSWDEIAMAFKNAEDCFAENALLFLASCRSNFRSSAATLFEKNRHLQHIVAPKSGISPQALGCCFHTLMYNYEFKHEDILTAVERAEAATGTHFAYFDRADFDQIRCPLVSTDNKGGAFVLTKASTR